MKSTPLATLLLPLLTPVLTGQDAAGPVDVPLQPTLPEATGTSRFGEPVVVNGKQISDLEIMRFLLYGKGRGGVESRKMEVLLDQEWQLRAFMQQTAILEEDFDGKALEDLSAEDQATVKASVDAHMSQFEYSPEELEERIAAERRSFVDRYPTLDYQREIERTYKSWDWYISQIEQTLKFDSMFFPGEAANWPDVTREAVHAGSPAFDLIEDYDKAYKLRVQKWRDDRGATEVQLLQTEYGGRTRAALTDDERTALDAAVNLEHGSFEPREDEMMMSLLRDFVIGTLTDPNIVTVQNKTDGVTGEYLLTLTGGGYEAKIETLDAWQEVEKDFTAEDIAEAKQFLALQVAVTDQLQADGILMPWSEFSDLLSQTKQSLSGGMFSFDFLALQGHNFPSMECYNDYLYLMESYRRSIIDEVSLDENFNLRPAMQEYLPIGTGIMGLAKVKAEALLVSAFDFPNNRWKENGWETAKAEADELRTRVDKHIDDLIAEDEQRRIAIQEGLDFESQVQPFDQFWADLLDLHSDYWDPPLPATGKMPAMVGMKFKGRFNGEAQTRNDLKRALNESTYSHYLYDENVVDEVFFSLEEGQVGGPYKGPWGYYVVYVVQKLRPTQPVNYRDERQLGLLQEDYLRRTFGSYAHAALKAAEVSGL